MVIAEFSVDLDLSLLRGRTVDAYFQDEGYWHLFVSLKMSGSDSLIFSTDECAAGPRFEVFPIRLSKDEEGMRQWKRLNKPLTIESVNPLWRNEWIESGVIGATLGEDPATQYAGRGPVPASALAHARVLAGVLLSGRDGREVVVASSNSAPFNVEIFLPGDSGSALNGFEPIVPNNLFKRTPAGAA